MNAILDALWDAFRIAHLDMPATPERVWPETHHPKPLIAETLVAPAQQTWSINSRA